MVGNIVYKRFLVFTLSCLATLFAYAQPANDDICNAELLTIDAVAVNRTNTDATAGANEVSGSCWTDPGIANNTVWFKIVFPSSGHVGVNVTNTDFDAQLAAYVSDNNTCTGVLTELGCADNNLGAGDEVADFCGTPGDTIFIQIDGYELGTLQTGNFDIMVADSAIADTPTTKVIDALCFGGTTGQITAIAAGTPDYNFVWRDFSNIILLNETTPDSSTLENLSAGTYSVQITDARNCVKSDTVEVGQVDTIANSTVDTAICEGDTFSIASSNYTMAGTYRDTLFASTNNGCDSIVTSNVTIKPISRDTLMFINTNCEGDTITTGGTDKTMDGTYNDTLASQSANGCDSIVTTIIVFNQNETIDTVATICTADTFFIADTFYTMTGIFVDTFEGDASNGCDLILNVDLTVASEIRDSFVVEICEGEFFAVGDSMYDETGIYEDTLTSSGGCDSIVYLDLTVLDHVVRNAMAVICEGESVTVGTSVYTMTGLYTDTLSGQAANGCDSIVNLDLTVNPTFNDTIISEICEGDTVFVGNNAYTESDIYTDTLQSRDACDSIITSVIIFQPSFQFDTFARICEGDSVEYRGEFFSQQGVYTDSFTTNEGCDSVFVLTLEVITPGTVFADTIEICEGDSIEIHGIFRDSAATYTDTFLFGSGCDSVSSITLELITELPDQFDTINICEGDTAFVDGNPITTDSTIVRTDTNMQGCTQMVTTDVFVNPTFSRDTTIRICVNDSVFLEGMFTNMPGMYSDTFSTSEGCDSVVNTTLFADTVLQTFDTFSVCSNNDTFTVHGNDTTGFGTYLDTFVSEAGCDSVSSVTVIDGRPANTFTNAQVCEGETININGTDRSMPGIYRDTLTTQDGCDSVVFTALVVNASPNPMIDGPSTTCDGGAVRLTTVNPYESYLWSQGDTTRRISAPIGSYSVSVVDSFGCSGSSDTFTVSQAPNINVDAQPDGIVEVELGSGLPLLVNQIPNATYAWTPAATVDCPTCPVTTARPTEDVTYTVVVTTEDGCSDEDFVTVTVIGNPVVDIPSSFTPNDDGENDVYRLYGFGLDQVDLVIFDRWGQKVFEKTEFEDGWDGTFDGNFSPQGRYIAYITLKNRFGVEIETIKQVITLLK